MSGRLSSQPNRCSSHGVSGFRGSEKAELPTKLLGLSWVSQVAEWESEELFLRASEVSYSALPGVPCVSFEAVCKCRCVLGVRV